MNAWSPLPTTNRPAAPGHELGRGLREQHEVGAVGPGRGADPAVDRRAPREPLGEVRVRRDHHEIAGLPVRALEVRVERGGDVVGGDVTAARQVLDVHEVQRPVPKSNRRCHRRPSR